MEPQVTIFLPVSRGNILDRIISNLELLECNNDRTNLLVMVDGDANLFLNTRNLVSGTKFNQKLVVQYSNFSLPIRRFSTEVRRRRIADIKNEAKQYMWSSDFVFGTEDDTILPPDSLVKLLKHYRAVPFAGMIEGLQLGRWGLPHIGAWTVDSIYEPTTISSIPMPSTKELVEIDAGGFYCYLTKAQDYLDHEYKPYLNNVLGPDVDYGMSLRLKGQKNYIDPTVVCNHYDEKMDKYINPRNHDIVQVRMSNQRGAWRFM